MPDDYAVPTWTGDPTEFEQFFVACQWYELSLKDSEKKQAASRVWSRLTGPAKSVVRNLDPEAYSHDGGLRKLLQVLRESPLQQLPVPDSFSRLEKWSSLRRKDNESIAELLVREEDLFTQLQLSLQRARRDRSGQGSAVALTNPGVTFDPQTPSQTGGDSPIRGAPRMQTAVDPPQGNVPAGGSSSVVTGNFFEDEMRGYRLLKSAHLSRQERQNVLTQTSNSTQFSLVRREGTQDFVRRRWWASSSSSASSCPRSLVEWRWAVPRRWRAAAVEWVSMVAWAQWRSLVVMGCLLVVGAWWVGVSRLGWRCLVCRWWWCCSSWTERCGWRDSVQGSLCSRSRSSQNHGPGSRSRETSETSPWILCPRKQFWKGYGITGFFSLSSEIERWVAGSGKGSYGPCFTCGMPGHGYLQCPDRFSKGRSKGKGKGKWKGKGKGKGKPSNYYDLCTLTVLWNEEAEDSQRFTRVVVDTGASENAIGADSLDKLLKSGQFMYSVDQSDRPTFRFGNGQRSQAASRVDIFGTALGKISFYVLVGGPAETTPPLLGASTLKSKKVGLSYDNEMFIYSLWNDDVRSFETFAVKMKSLPSRHITIDLMGQATKLSVADGSVWHLADASTCSNVSSSISDSGWSCDEKFLPLYMMENVLKNENVLENYAAESIPDRLQCLALKLDRLRQDQHEQQRALSNRRPSETGVSMLRQTCGQNPSEQISSVVNMHSLRSPFDLHQQVRSDGGNSPHGSRAKLAQGHPRRDAVDNSSRSSEREDDHRSPHGSPRCDVAARSCVNGEHQPVLGGLSEETSSPTGCFEHRDTASEVREAPSREAEFNQEVHSGREEGRISGAAVEDTCDYGNLTGDQADHRGGNSQTGFGQDGVGREGAHGCEGMGCDQYRVIDRQEGRVASLWSALSSLRSRMSNLHERKEPVSEKAGMHGDKEHPLKASVAPSLKEMQFQGDKDSLQPLAPLFEDCASCRERRSMWISMARMRPNFQCMWERMRKATRHLSNLSPPRILLAPVWPRSLPAALWLWVQCS